MNSAKALVGSTQLIKFLDQYPFSTRSFMEKSLGKLTVDYVLDESGSEFQRVYTGDNGILYANKNEPKQTLLDIGRLEIAREFAFEVMGDVPVICGLSPGPEADGEFLWDDWWWRLWVDVGGCAPEALGFIRHPPDRHSADVRDIVLTTQAGHLKALAKQIERNWMGGKAVFVWLAGTNEYRQITTRRRASATRVWKPYEKKDIEGYLSLRKKGDRRKSYLGGVASNLQIGDWELLIEIGNNPLFSAYELAYLRSDKQREMEKTYQHVRKLSDLGLIKTARTSRAADLIEERKVLSSKALELLAGHWGAALEDLRRFHPWPQARVRKDRKQRKYSKEWLSRLAKHQAIVRKFTLSMIHGARCVSNSIGGVDVKIESTVGDRMLYEEITHGRQKRLRWVSPDARAVVGIWKKGWLDGDVTVHEIPVAENTLLIEVDRSRMISRRLHERIVKYKRIWKAMKEWDPVLLWVIEGTPYREKTILDMMRKAGVEGWTVLVERLVIPEDDVWWTINAPVQLNSRGLTKSLSYGSIGGMAPWRDVWYSTSGNGMQSLLGLTPWTGRELRRSLPRRMGQEWIRHKSW